MEVKIEMQGLRPALNLDDISSMNDNQIRKFKDARGFNLLMLASEAGHVEAVQNVIDRKLFNVNFETGGENAISLAVARFHHEVVLALLKANAKFPQNFNGGAASDELKEFLDLSQEMHVKVREVNEKNLVEVKEFLRQNIEANPSVKYFYDTSNCSLIKRSLQARQFGIFKVLWDLNLKLSPDESLQDDLESFTDEEKENFEKLHLAIFDDFQSLSHREITQFRDFRGFNALMLAAEFSKIEETKFCIEKGFFILDASFKNITAASLAYDHKNFEVFLLLLNADAEFPPSFDPSKIEDKELKSFIEMSNSIHAHVDSNDCEKVEEILQSSPLNYFYDLQNRSLFCHAIESKKFEIYKILIKNRVTLGPSENFNAMLKNYSEEEKSELSKIQLELADPLVSPTVLSLMAHSFVGYDSKNQKRAAAMEAFNLLLKIPRAQIIVKIVATQKNFQIVFDFKRDTVQFVDPSAELYASGMFYSQGRIYIAAKKLFDEDDKFKVMGVLIHELCHFAMFITFNNYAKPSHKLDKAKEHQFEEIIKSCEPLKDLEEIIRLVYAEYDASWHPTELIVRPVQIDVHYHGLNELEGKQKDFKELYGFYDNHCIPEMEKILPDLESKADKDEEIKKLKKSNVGLIIMVALSIFLGSLAAFLIFDPPISWSELSSEDKGNLNNSIVKFHGVEIKFGELFSNDSKVYGLLSSEQIRKAQKGKTEELSKALKETLHHQVFLTWSNMTQKLREKFLTRKVDFQGQKVKIGKISKSGTTLGLLSVDQVRKILNKKSFKISSAAEQRVKVYIQRFFTHKTAIVKSEEYYERYEKNSEKINFVKFYENGSIDTDNPNVTSFDTIVENFDSLKIFLLSSFAGDGKTTTFRHFGLKLKEKFPRKWIQFVDLKKHIEGFETGQNLNFNKNATFLNFLGEKVSNLSGFELELFKELFASGNVIFLLDGIDEVSTFKDFLLKLTEKISKTKNFQFISTRPQHSESFEDKFSVKAQKLIPFSERDRFEFMVKTIADKKFKENGSEIFEKLKHFYNKDFDQNHNQNISKYFETITKVRIIFNVTGAPSKGESTSNNFVSNPLLISMISEISCNENFEIENSSFNSYELYETFCLQKLKIIEEKGAIVQNDRDRALWLSSINIWRVHQFFAIKLLSENDNIIRSENYDFTQIHFNYLSTRLNKSLQHFTPEQISRYGILQVNSIYKDRYGKTQYDFDFAHRSFAEFFLAQFFFKFLETNEKPDLTKDDNKWELLAFFKFFVRNFNFKSKSFFNNAVKSKGLESDFLTYWNNQTNLNKKLTNNTTEKKKLEYIQFSNYFGMEKFDFHLNSVYPYCFDELHNLYEVEKVFDANFVRSIFNYRRIEYLVPLFVCSFESTCHGYDPRLSEEIPKHYMEVAKKVLSKSEIKSLLFETKAGENDQNVLMLSVEESSCLNLTKLLWEFIKENLDNEEQKLFLSQTSLYGKTILSYLTLNENPEIVTFLRNIYKEVFNENERKENFLIDENIIEFLRIDEKHRQTNQEFLKYARELFALDDYKFGKVGFELSDEKHEKLIKNYSSFRRKFFYLFIDPLKSKWQESIKKV